MMRPGEILGTDGHLAETPMQEGGQLASVGLVVVLAVALLQQPVDGQLIDEAGIGDIAQAESGQILVDLGLPASRWSRLSNNGMAGGSDG